MAGGGDSGPFGLRAELVARPGGGNPGPFGQKDLFNGPNGTWLLLPVRGGGRGLGDEGGHRLRL